MSRKKQAIVPRNPAAAALGHGLFKNKIQQPKTNYKRKPKHNNNNKDGI